MSSTLKQPMALLDAWEATPDRSASLSDRHRLEGQLRALCVEQGLTTSDQRIQEAVSVFLGHPAEALGVNGGRVQTDTLTSVPIVPLTTLSWLRPENRATWEAALQDLAVWKQKRIPVGLALFVGCAITGGLLTGLLDHIAGALAGFGITTLLTGALLGFVLREEHQRPHFERVATRFPWLRDPSNPQGVCRHADLSARLAPVIPTPVQVNRWRSHPVTAGWFNLIQQMEVPLIQEDVRHLESYLENLTPAPPRRAGTPSTREH